MVSSEAGSSIWGFSWRGVAAVRCLVRRCAQGDLRRYAMAGIRAEDGWTFEVKDAERGEMVLDQIASAGVAWLSEPSLGCLMSQLFDTAQGSFQHRKAVTEKPVQVMLVRLRFQSARITSLLHYLSVDLLRDSFYALSVRFRRGSMA